MRTESCQRIWSPRELLEQDLGLDFKCNLNEKFPTCPLIAFDPADVAQSCVFRWKASVRHCRFRLLDVSLSRLPGLRAKRFL